MWETSWSGLCQPGWRHFRDGVLLVCLTAVMSLSNVVTMPGRRDGEWWIGPSREENTFQLVFSMAFWADRDVALVTVLGQAKGWSNLGSCPQPWKAQGLGPLSL